jgi:hypothetical protein
MFTQLDDVWSIPLFLPVCFYLLNLIDELVHVVIPFSWF